MGSYFLVQKKIGKHRYWYRQRVWKENGKTRTHSIYVGRSDKIPRQALNSFLKNTELEQKVIEKVFNISEIPPTPEAPITSDTISSVATDGEDDGRQSESKEDCGVK